MEDVRAGFSATPSKASLLLTPHILFFVSTKDDLQVKSFLLRRHIFIFWITSAADLKKSPGVTAQSFFEHLHLLKRFILTTWMCIWYVEITLIISIETYKEVTQLVSTSNKRPSSGEMKIDLKRVGIYREMDLTLVVIKDELWRLMFTPHMEVDWSMISVMCGCQETFAIKSDVWRHVFTPCGVFGDKGMKLLNSCLGVKEPSLFVWFWILQTTQFCSFLVLQALVESFGYVLNGIWSKTSNIVKLG